MTDDTSPGIAGTATAGEFGPVKPAERIKVVDILRGFALLGILVVNMDYFAFPAAVIFDPRIAGGFTGLDGLTWKFNSLFFLEKMMALFSMLFGAGLVLMYDRATAAGKKLGGVYYRRILWLLVIGAIHGYLLWYGDILFSYAIAGLILFLFRKRSARTLIIVGCFVLVFGALIKTGGGFANGLLRAQAEGVGAILDAGGSVTPQQREMYDTWQEVKQHFTPGSETMSSEIAAYRGGYRANLESRVPMTLMMQTQALIFMVLWRAMGLMLIGMGLMKSGFLTGERSRRFYVSWAIIGYGAGLPLCGWGIKSLLDRNFDFIHYLIIGGHYNYAGSILVAMANVSIIVLVFRAGLLTWLTDRLAGAGRMALSNYLLQTLIGTTIFYGFGFGLFNHVNRFALWGFIIAFWILQLYISPLWLRKFRFGPAEWLWRTLTYWKVQPFRVKPASTAGPS
ncbi:MAG: DUF418 domain-containing protein [Candidatus Zixiibacteriota bacterium]|nr:MAG: DUF418 domain-containing protein [candidate division Zixibacteria bacterium]